MWVRKFIYTQLIRSGKNIINCNNKQMLAMKPGFYLLGLFLLFSVVIQCRKNKNTSPVELPPVTQDGKNTFGFKLNGEIWIPYSECSFSGNPCGELFTDVYRTQPSEMLPFSFSLAFAKDEKDNTSTAFSIQTKASGIYTIGNKIDSLTILFTKPVGQLYYNYNYHGKMEKVEITKVDVANGIISGVFELTLYQSINDSVKITEGRFDLRFPLCKCSK